MLSVAPRPGRSAPSWWILRLTADPNGSAAAIDGWGHDANVQFTGPMGDSAYVDPGNTIAGPASAASAITVGAVTSRDSWPDARGTPSNSAQLTLGEVCPFSNQGPTASGLERPDLVAPGAYVLSARASELASSFGQTQDPLLACALGTSQATPAVAGLIAIGLARKPQLGPQQVRQAIHAVATMPFGQGGVFDPAWGYGEVTAATLLPSL
jgi:serine protease AprX